MKNILIALGIIILAVGAYMLFRKDEIVIDNVSGGQTSQTQQTGTVTGQTTQKTSGTTQTNATKTSSVTITYTNTGFSPKTVQIAKGTKVTFINKSSKPMMIVADDSSNPKYVELNQPKSIGNGGIYTFNFVYAGVWAYHNELAKEHTANIVVY